MGISGGSRGREMGRMEGFTEGERGREHGKEERDSELKELSCLRKEWERCGIQGR